MKILKAAILLLINFILIWVFYILGILILVLETIDTFVIAQIIDYALVSLVAYMINKYILKLDKKSFFIVQTVFVLSFTAFILWLFSILTVF